MLSVLFVSCGKEGEKAKDEKDTLVFAQISECKTLDPQDTTEQYSQRIVAVVYDRLVEISDNYTRILKDIERVLGMEDAEVDVNSLFIGK